MCSCRHKCARSGVTILPSSRSALNAPHGNTGQQGDACDGARGVPAAGATGEILGRKKYNGPFRCPRLSGRLHRKGNVESMGPTPTRPPIRAVPFVFEANAAASRRLIPDRDSG